MAIERSEQCMTLLYYKKERLASAASIERQYKRRTERHPVAAPGLLAGAGNAVPADLPVVLRGFEHGTGEDCVAELHDLEPEFVLAGVIL